MWSGIDGIELGLVVNLGVLSSAMKKVSAAGARWWIACDPRNAIEDQHLTIGFGCQGCKNQLNVAFFCVPVLNAYFSPSGVDELVVIWDLNVVSPQWGDIDADTFQDFFVPIKRELIEQLRSQNSLMM
jgi:hypothetical protein